MARSFRLLVFPALVAGTLLSQQASHAQAPVAPPVPAAKAAAPTNYDYNPLPTLPKPPDAPASLLQPAQNWPPYTCAPLPGPYFQRDPLWDSPSLPQPGWVAEVDVGIVKPNVQNNLSGPVQIPGRAADQVHLPNASLDWTAAPHILVGYSLPSAFGEVALGYRGFASEGNSTITGADGPAALHSRVDFNQAELEYLSHEYSLWPQWEMQWHCGLRLTYLYFDSQADEDMAVAAAGSGVYQQHESNSYWGIGPNAGFELARHFEGTGLSFVVALDGTSMLGRVRQGFSETATTGATGTSENSGSQAVPVLDGKIGVSWQPPQRPQWSVFVGYEYEHFWNVGRLSSTTDSRGDLTDQGLTIRLGYNF